MPSKLSERTLGFLIHDVARLWRRRFEQQSQSLGLTRSQWSVIAHLARREGASQTALADILEIEPITLVRLLDRLESAGWVERRPDPDDRRVRRLYLTDKAHPILGEMQALGAAVQDEALSGLEPEARDLLFHALLTARANLSQRVSSGAGDDRAQTRKVSHG